MISVANFSGSTQLVLSRPFVAHVLATAASRRHAPARALLQLDGCFVTSLVSGRPRIDEIAGSTTTDCFSPSAVPTLPKSTRAFLVPDFDQIPMGLRTRPRWVTWLLEGKPGEAPRKVPYNPTLPNRSAKANDPDTWGTFEQAVGAYEEGDRTGIGIVLDGDGLVGVDLDHCVRDGVIDPRAIALLRDLDAQYIEFSPSGTGLRAFGFADGLATGCKGKYNGLDVELYSTGRYLTVTGKAVLAGAIGPLKGFSSLANGIRADRQVNRETGAVEYVASNKRQAELVRRVLSGDVLHDSLRDLAAAFVATGMHAGAVVNLLYGLMDNSTAQHDGRWNERRKSIPGLVSSALLKFSPQSPDINRIVGLPGAARSEDETGEGIEACVARYKVLSASELANASPLQWIIRGLYPATGLVALYGQSGSGKSFLALDMAVSIAGGATDWYGMRITSCPVTYCVLEGEAGMGKRVSAWAQHHDKPVPDALRFVTQPINLLMEGDVSQLAQAIEQGGGGGGVIILDTLNRAAPAADENSSKDMGAIIAAAKRLQDLTGGLVVLVHHTGKVVENGMRGHSSLFAAMDGVIGVANSKEHGLSWTVAKSKDDATGAVHTFQLQQVIVGIDDEGEDITSCVALPVAPPLALRKSKRLGQHQQTAKDVLQRLFDESPVSAEVPLEAAIQAVADQIAAGPRHKRQRAKEAMEGLALKLMIEATDTHIRPIHRPA